MPGRLVVADAGPLHYLVLIGHSDILPALFEKIFLPTIVRDELAHIEAPSSVRKWMENPPAWLAIRTAPVINDPSLQPLDDGKSGNCACGRAQR